MKKAIKFLFLVFGLLFFGQTGAQVTDLARVEYTYFPQRESDNSFRRFRTFFNYPIELNKEGSYLVPGIEYRNVNFKYDDPELFETGDLDRFQSFTASLAYTFKMKNDWRFGAQTGLKIASNFSRGIIANDDLIYDGAIFFIKVKNGEEIEKPWRLILGVNYSTTRGFPFPLPVINYYKEFSPDWSYSVGVPKSNLRYSISEKSTLQAFVTLDGFFANVQENFDVTPRNNHSRDAIAENMSMTILLSGLGYEYNFTEHLSFYVYAGYTLINDIRFRDSNMDDVLTINDTNTFYSRGGLKFSIL
ncbi:DUF6268 family outer membrane beta-barrel protein [Salegentibacter sp. F188]|uniref:DUF6268 family outer membrane beta-barrel protein n=1 Tax=Autumnicola patrickiae TaxID=3075591 RepID=A0ABU3E0L1_9FLAO|nr:DUF6268 family outer membrane beta-barrel protein [Salegentibacter sp. F188]MDT0689525.1 DUF6268 family outer membrane beta-barrel protein [Salegentibacter sp. F188]